MVSSFPIHKASNGVTVLCSNVLIGGTGIMYGVTYTKPDRAVFFSLLHRSPSLLETMCIDDVEVGVRAS